jgi:hypothetical protein
MVGPSAQKAAKCVSASKIGSDSMLMHFNATVS